MRMQHNMYLLHLILVYALSLCLLPQSQRLQLSHLSSLPPSPWPSRPAEASDSPLGRAQVALQKVVAARNTDVASVQVSEAARRLSTTAQNAFLVSSVCLCTYLLS